jgi:protein gp37
MADRTAIAWTDHTFNPWMGCFKVSQGCKHCYAETLTKGKMQLDVFGYDTSKRKRTGKATWRKPFLWNRDAEAMRTPARVFCASLADVFEDAPGPNEWREDVWNVIRANPWLDFQLLTKRPENIPDMLPDTWADNPWGYWPNVWLGTSIEDNRVAERAPILTSTPAIVHFISYEPAIGPGDQIPLEGLEWMIVGGESGPGFRRMDLLWAFDMWDRCKAEDVAFFFKQNSAARTEMGIDALGEVVREYPLGWDRGGVR